MLKIRLARGGAKKRPYYSIVVADSHSPRDGRFIEKVGTYNPLLKKDDPNRVVLKVERIQEWMSKGAQPTDRVARELGQAGPGEVGTRQQPEQGQAGHQGRGTRRRNAPSAKPTAPPAIEEAKNNPPPAPEPEPVVEEAPAAEAAPAEEAAPAAEEAPLPKPPRKNRLPLKPRPPKPPLKRPPPLKPLLANRPLKLRPPPRPPPLKSPPPKPRLTKRPKAKPTQAPRHE